MLPSPEPDVPDPWEIGPKVYLASSSKERRFDVLLAGNERPTQILFDEDAPVIGDEPDLPEIARDFDAEAAFHFYDTRRIAYYDRYDLGEFDLILVDQDHDGSADIRYVERNGSWKVEKNVDMPWFSTGYLAYLSSEDGKRIDQAVRQFAFLANNVEEP